jgi:hypothetical protein
MGYTVIRRRSVNCKGKGVYTAGADHARDHTVITASNPTAGMGSGDCGDARTANNGYGLIQGIEAANMIRKGQALGITQQNLHGQAWLFGFPLGLRQATASTNDWSCLLRRRCNTSVSRVCHGPQPARQLDRRAIALGPRCFPGPENISVYEG